MKPQSAFFCNLATHAADLDRVFSPHLRAQIAAQTSLLPQVVTPANFEALADQLCEVEVIFATWGMWELSTVQIRALPNLKAVFYAAGSVKHFALPLLERDVIVTSRWQANAVPVAEFTLAQILLANKGYFANVAQYRRTPDYNDCFRGRGNYGTTVSILGAGQVGRRVMEFLRPHRLRVLVFDPFLSHKATEVLGAEKVETLEEAFSRGDIVSNHLAEVRATRGMLRGDHFAAMPSNANFINTGRGRTANQDELFEVFQRRSDLTALLDVTEPEPLPLSHPLRALHNVHISGHIAGSIGDEVERMAEFALAEFDRWTRGEPLRYAITADMLETMA